MTDLERLVDECNNCQNNVLMALADLVEESGDEFLAKGYRWLAINHRWPRMHFKRYAITKQRQFSWCVLKENTSFSQSYHIPYYSRTFNKRFNSIHQAISTAAEEISKAIARGELSL